MGVVDPVTDNAAVISNQIMNNTGEDAAYIYSDEESSFTTGWHAYPLGNNATIDLQNILGQGWFAIGIYDRDESTTYYINFDGWNETNPPFLIVSYEYIIPVELTAFTATSKDGNVTLNWSTATETNNRGFEIERKISNGEYQKIGFTAGSGTTTEKRSYSFMDNQPGSGNFIYRIKQIDFNGNAAYSKEVEVNVTSPLKYALEQNYPNPFNPDTKIKYSIPDEGLVKIKVYNLLGQEVTTLVNNVQKAGRYEVVFNATNFASGVYYYRIEAPKFYSVKKMIVLK
jgi:hypothetical protein